MYAISTNQLTKKFDNFTAVNQINIHVPLGKVYGFIGPNGAGKTTTIGMIMGHKKITNGSIDVFDEKVDFFKTEYKRRLGFVSDVPEFYNWMTASEFLTFCGNIFNLEKEIIQDRIIQLLDLVDLEDSKKSIGSYSRGMRQRLGIAQALMHDPDIIIMDEPTSALDPIGRKDVMDIIEKLKGDKTIFYSTHILTDVERVCDVVGIIHKGNLLLEDTLENIKEKYYDTKFVIETDQTYETLVNAFKKEKWFTSMTKNKHENFILVNDENQAMLEIPKLIGSNNWKLKRFEKQDLTLEDIFLKVVGK